MEIPKKIKVGNIEYTVKFKKFKNDFGRHRPKRQEIVLDKGMTPEMERNCFFHELTHALLFQIGAFVEQKDEILVQSLANELDKLFDLKTTKQEIVSEEGLPNQKFFDWLDNNGELDKYEAALDISEDYSGSQTHRLAAAEEVTNYITAYKLEMNIL
jgi:hypothetical protein